MNPNHHEVSYVGKKSPHPAAVSPNPTPVYLGMDHAR